MKNITISIPDDVYRSARVRAAENDTSVSAMVGEYLRSLSSQAAEFARLERQQKEITRGVDGFRASDRIGRDEVHDRSVR